MDSLGKVRSICFLSAVSHHIPDTTEVAHIQDYRFRGFRTKMQRKRLVPTAVTSKSDSLDAHLMTKDTDRVIL